MFSYENAFRALYWIAFLGCATFVVSYEVKTKGKWKESEVGVMLMTVYGDLAFLLGWLIISQYAITWLGIRWFEFITLILFIVFALATWWPLRLLYILHRREHKEQDDQL